MTQKEIFEKYLKIKGFNVKPNYSYVSLIPYHYLTNKKDNILISDITITMFDGSDTKPGDLGCTCFYYGAKQKDKYKKRIYQVEALKKCVTNSIAKEVYNEFEQWLEDTTNIINSWKVIL